MMTKKIIVLFALSVFILEPAAAFDFSTIKPINPLENNPAAYQEVINQPVYELKRGTLTKNAIKINIPLLWINLCKVMSVLLIRISEF